VAICLHTSPLSHGVFDYFITGSLAELGSWRDKKRMRLMDKDMKESFVKYFSNDP